MGVFDFASDALKLGGDIYGAFEQSDRAASAAKLAYKRTLYMSNTAIQRRVEDLKAAGLNPMLAYNSAASAGNVAAAPMTGPVGLGRNLSTFLERQESRSRADANKASAEAARANAMKARTEVANMAVNAAYTQAQTGLIESQTRKNEYEINDLVQRMRDDPDRYISERQIRELSYRLQRYTENEAEQMSRFWHGTSGQTAAYVRGFGPAINAAGDILNIGNQLKGFVDQFKGFWK